MQNEKVFFSVICPTYNSSNYIKKNFNSLLAQKYRNFEVIYIDDGSIDKTVEMLKRLVQNHKNFKLYTKKHKGPSSARNFGIMKSNGNWIALIDSDDTWHPSKLKKISQVILENKEKNFIVHWEKYIKLNGEIKILKHGFETKNKYLFQQQLYKSNFLSTSASILKKKLILKNGFFDEKLPNAQDYDLWLKLAPHINLFIIKKILGGYYETKNSITSRPYYKRILSELRIAMRYRKYYNFYFIKIIKILFSKRWFR
jgi:glycosyltransferase involved in cell wall biosynthesis